MNRMQIILTGHLDKSLLNAPGVVVTVTDAYTDARGSAEMLLDDRSHDFIDAVQILVDAATFYIEENALIWSFEREGKSFDLTKSYVRASEDTSVTDSLPAGSVLKVRFEVPGFQTFKSVTIDLWYGQDFNPADLLALQDELNIVLTGNGSDFSFAATSDCRVSFSKPEIITDRYIIDYDASQIIGKDE